MPPSATDFLRWGAIAAGAKTEKKHEKKPNVADQKARRCGSATPGGGGGTR